MQQTPLKQNAVSCLRVLHNTVSYPQSIETSSTPLKPELTQKTGSFMPMYNSVLCAWAGAASFYPGI